MIIYDLPISDYHKSAPAWLSKTTLRDFREHGPAWWKAVHLDRTLSADRPGGALQGSALDCLLTEGDDAFRSRYAIRPQDIDGRTTVGKAWAADHKGMDILSHADGVILREAADAVRRCCLWPEIQQAAAQATIRRESSILGLGLQSRPDWLRIDGNRAAVYDLKKTADLDGFGRQAINLGYHLQAAIAAWCLAGDGIQVEASYLVAVEWERHARCRVYKIPDVALLDGHLEMVEIAKEIAARVRSGDWTDTQAEAEPLPIPDWQARRMALRAEQEH